MTGEEVFISPVKDGKHDQSWLWADVLLGGKPGRNGIHKESVKAVVWELKLVETLNT